MESIKEPDVAKSVMATTNGESSSSILKSPSEKPVVVRVKRKASQSLLDAFWLEINERPLKRPFVDFEKLSISESSEKLKTTRVLVEHVQTVLSPEATIDIVQLVLSNSADATEDKTRTVDRRNTFKKDNRPNPLSKSRQKQEESAKNARFEQIWRSRRGKKEEVDEMCHFYEVVRVDGVEERSNDVKDQQNMSLEDHRILTSYLPLLREFIPSAAEEIESDLQAQMSSQDEYVYDLYTVKDEMDIEEDAKNPFPLVQYKLMMRISMTCHMSRNMTVKIQMVIIIFRCCHENLKCFCITCSILWWLSAEDNPRNDYPDGISEVEDKLESKSKDSENSEPTRDRSSELEYFRYHGSLEDGDVIAYENETYDDYHDEVHDFDHADGDDNEDGEDWRWSYR